MAEFNRTTAIGHTATPTLADFVGRIEDIAQVWYFMIRPAPDTLGEYLSMWGMGVDEFRALQDHDMFKGQVEKLSAMVAADPNVFLKIKAAAYLEQGVDMLRSIMADGDENATARIKAFEVLKGIAEPNKPPVVPDDQFAGFPKISITIVN